MRRIMSMVTVALLMAAMMAAMASSAAATEPVVEEHHSEGTVVLADCGDFQVLDRFVLGFTERFFLDQSGTLVRIVSTVSGTDTFINSETGKEIPTTTGSQRGNHRSGGGVGRDQRGDIARYCPRIGGHLARCRADRVEQRFQRDHFRGGTPSVL